MSLISVLDTTKSLDLMAPPIEVQGVLSSSLEKIKLSGSVESVTYFNPVNGQYVFEFKPFQFKSHILLTGFTAFLHPGLTVEAEIFMGPTHQQNLAANKMAVLDRSFSAHKLEVKTPSSARTLRKFLKAIELPGMGSHLIKTLSKAYPDNFFSVLENDPESLCETPGIGKKRQAQILKAWGEFKYITAFEQFLFDCHLPVNWARTLWPSYGFDSLQYLKEKAYEAAREYNFDFDLIDVFVLKNGGDPSSLQRVRGALYYILQTKYTQGNCAHPEERFIAEAMEKLTVDLSLIEEALEIELLEENFVSETIGDTACIYLREVWEIEQNVARQFLDFQKKPPPWGWFNMEKVLTWSQDLLNIDLAPLQIEAIEKALSSSLTLITGGPGTGKTTLIRSLVTILKTQFAPFVLCSPTGRGAQRLEEATGAPAQTIHRLLKFNSLTGEFTYNKNNPLNYDLVLIDEVSMVDIALMSHLLDALSPQCALILVGDVDQIPPVGAGHILQSLIQSGRFTTVKLTEIFRQSGKSAIKESSRRINEGKMPEDAGTDGDFHFISVKGTAEMRQTVAKLVTQTIPNTYGIDDLRQIQVLAPMNRGVLGTIELNRYLQKRLRSTIQPQKTISGFEQNFRVGDKVMVTKNDYRKEVFNGDIGFISNIDPFEQLVEVQFDRRSLFYHFEEMDKLTLAYAISIHKSQGSEYKAVVVVLAEEHLPLAQRQLIYTAVTRGKEQVFLVAEPAALQAAILSDEHNLRWQKLTELLA